MTKKSDAPAIRFKGFSDAWEQRKAKELCNIGTGKSNTQDQVEDGIYPFYIRSDIPVKSNKYLYDCEAVITIGDGNIGRVFHYVNGKFDLHQRCYKMTDFQDIWGKYFYYFFSTRFYDRAMKMTAKATVDSVRLEMISEMDIWKPTAIDEQKKIAEFFANLDNLITLHQRQPFLHSTPEISLTVQLIHPFYTSSWEQRKFSDVVATRRGLTYKPSDIRKNGVRVLRSSNIAEDSFVLSDEDVFVVREAVNIDCVRANDILITAANGSSRLVGKHTIISGIPEESAVHGGFMLLGTTKEPHFVNASMGSSWYRRFIELFVAGGNGAIGNLNKNDLDNQDIAIPSEKEQKKIGSFFRQLDNLITLHQRKGKAAVTGCSNDVNNSKGVYCKARDFGYKCCKKVESP